MSSLTKMANNNHNSASSAKEIGLLIEKKKNYIIETLQSEVKYNKFKSNLIRLYNDTSLKTCTPLSVLGAAMQVANLQLDLDPTLGHAFVLSRWDSKARANLASFQIGYQGLLELVRRSGDILRVESHIVWENESYEYFFDDVKGTIIRHFPLPPSKRGETRIATYFVAFLTNGSVHKEWVWGEEVEYIKDASLEKIKPEYQKYSPWMSSQISEDAMWKKTAIRRGVKYLPKTSEIETVFALEDEEAKGNIIDYENATNGEIPKIITPTERTDVVAKQTIPAPVEIKPIYTPKTIDSRPQQKPVSQPQPKVVVDTPPAQKPSIQTQSQEASIKQPAQNLFDPFDDPFIEDSYEDFDNSKMF